MVSYIFVIIGWDSGLTPDRHHAITSANADLLLRGYSRTNCREIQNEIRTFPFKGMCPKMSYVKLWLFWSNPIG